MAHSNNLIAASYGAGGFLFWFPRVIATVCAFGLGGAITAQAEPIVGGYVASWHSRALVERLPLEHYTHVFHAFLTAEEDGELIKSKSVPNRWLPARAHKAGCKIILSLGGGGYHHFPAICGDAKRRERFARNVAALVQEYGYDGVDVDWEHPRTKEEGGQWIELVRDLRAALDHQARATERKERYLLTTAVFSSDWGSKWIDAKAVDKELDFINVMTYDFAGAWGGVVGPHAALVATDDSGLSITKAMEYWHVKRGIAKSKLIVGLPFYGFFFHDCKLGERLENGHGRKVEALRWSEVVDRLKGDGWSSRYTAEKDALLVEYKGKPTIVGSIDDVRVIKKKTDWSLKNEYGGVFVWELGHEIDAKKTHTPLSDAIRDAVKLHNNTTKEKP